jgi:acyl transferase domain-containing protein
VVLKRVEDAIADGDSIDALIIGSAINNDGHRKVGFTAPSVDGQEEVIRLAQRLAEVHPEEVDFLETHGSATPLGDTIELEALRRVFPKKQKPYCAIGTSKANVGHTNSASGVVGLIKAVLGIKKKLLFPQVNFQTPNPALELENSPFYITKQLKSLEGRNKPLIAGVSSFGVGGTNAHIVLKEAPIVSRPENGRDKNIIILSAKTETALEKQRTQLLGFLKAHPTTDFNDLAYTLQVGRSEFAHRTAFVAHSVEEIISALDGNAARGVWKNTLDAEPRFVFMFTGQGKQYVNMGRELYDTQPFFKAEMDTCFSLAENYTRMNYKSCLYPSESDEAKKAEWSDTSMVQPLLFCFEYALAKFLMHLGIHPHAMIGYSFGEITAACIADVLRLEDAIKLVVIRGELMKNA